jgi:hypothetical protein
MATSSARCDQSALPNYQLGASKSNCTPAWIKRLADPQGGVVGVDISAERKLDIAQWTDRERLRVEELVPTERAVLATWNRREPHHVTRAPTLPLRVMRDSPLTEVK